LVALLVAPKPKFSTALAVASNPPTVSVPEPLLFPAARVPPSSTETGPLMTPVPARVVPLVTVTVPGLFSAPFTAKVPPLTEVGPENVFVPFSRNFIVEGGVGA
jgi:hypothetical protein